ncbi:PKD domain-containing protein [Mucilaginibacter sp. HD30]
MRFQAAKRSTIQNFYRTVVFGFLFALLGHQAYSQSFGDPAVITFGSGPETRYGILPPQLGVTPYEYSSEGFISEGYYTIANTTSGMSNQWPVIPDHTPFTPIFPRQPSNGYMMIFNAGQASGVFYSSVQTGLCANTQYQFVTNITRLLTNRNVFPNVTFSIETTDGTVLGTGKIIDTPPIDWWGRGLVNFTTPVNTNTIVIKMTINGGGAFAIDDITITPFGKQVSAVFAQSGTTQSVCAGAPVTINATTTLASGYVQKLQAKVNGVWTDQTAADSVKSFSTTAPTDTGIYYYRLVSAHVDNIDANQCVVASNQIKLTVVDPPEVAFAVVGKCLGDSTVFKDQTKADGSTISAWLWNFGDGKTSALQNPSHLYSQPGNYTVQLVISSNNGCATAIAEKTIHISESPVAAFTFTTPDCVTKAVTLTDQSTATEGNISSWIWDYGDGTIETKNNNAVFQHTFASAGTFIIKLVVTAAGGCSSTKTRSITVNPTPVVNFGIPAICLADASASFTDSTTIADNSSAGFSYLWDFGDNNASAANPNTSTLKNANHKYSTAAVYKVTLTVTSNNGCSASRTQNITVNGSVPVAAFTVLNPSQLCSNREVLFTNLSTVDFGAITKIEWYFDYGNKPTVKITDNSPYSGKLYRHTYPTFHAPASANYQVRMLAYSGLSCVSLVDKTITLLAAPQLAFTAPLAFCINDADVQLSASELAGVAGTGLFVGTGLSSTGLFSPSTAGAGTFTLRYIYTCTNGCTDTLSNNVTVNALPEVNAGADMGVLQGASTSMTATASGDNLTYLWSPATGLSSSTVLKPVVTPVNDITYTLTVTNSNGCAVSDQVLVKVLKAVIVPNAFTPNGDNYNDTWNINYLDTYTDCTVDVFNRQGAKVFSSIGYRIPWDGKYKNADLPMGTYYYLINLKHSRGVMSGYVTIVR